MFNETNVTNLETQEAMKDDITCSICQNILDEPVCCQCSATFCRTCISQTDKCPICREQSKYDGNTKLISKFLDKLLFKCPYSSCEEISPYSIYQKHIMKCEKQIENDNKLEPIIVAQRKLISEMQIENQTSSELIKKLEQTITQLKLKNPEIVDKDEKDFTIQGGEQEMRDKFTISNTDHSNKPLIITFNQNLNVEHDLLLFQPLDVREKEKFISLGIVSENYKQEFEQQFHSLANIERKYDDELFKDYFNNHKDGKLGQHQINISLRKIDDKFKLTVSSKDIKDHAFNKEICNYLLNIDNNQRLVVMLPFKGQQIKQNYHAENLNLCKQY